MTSTSYSNKLPVAIWTIVVSYIICLSRPFGSKKGRQWHVIRWQVLGINCERKQSFCGQVSLVPQCLTEHLSLIDAEFSLYALQALCDKVLARLRGNGHRASLCGRSLAKIRKNVLRGNAVKDTYYIDSPYG